MRIWFDLKVEYTLKHINLTESKLSTLKRLMYQFNIRPILLPHYLTKHHPIQEVFISLVNEAHELVCLLDLNESEELIDNFSWFYKEGVKDKLLGTREYTIAVYTVLYHVMHNKILFESVVNSQESTVLATFPELTNKLDKDGLLILDEIFIPTPFGIVYKENVIYYHQLLRKDYGGPFIPEFIRAFLKLNQSGVESRIAIDHNRIIPIEYIDNTLELDYWFGPPFSTQKIDDPEETGLTVIERTHQPLLDNKRSLVRTEFLWKMKDDITKQIEIEEISHLENKFDDYYFNRYIHAERNITQKCFVHFDGAVKVYQEEALLKRLKVNLQNDIGSNCKIKLFRFDGNI